MSEITEIKSEIIITENVGNNNNNKKLLYDEDRNTPVHFAASSGDVEVLSKEIESFPKIDVENHLGWTPLMMAARNGHLDVIKILVELKADATKKNRFGASIFMMATASGNLDAIEYILKHLLSGGVSKQIIESTLSPIAVAILFKHEAIIQYLITKGFNVNHANPSTGVTPLMFAAVLKNSNVFNTLISNGANLYAKNINQQTAQDITVLINKFKQQYSQYHANQMQQQQEEQQQQQQQQQRQQQEQQHHKEQQHQHQEQQQHQQLYQQQLQQQQPIPQFILPHVLPYSPISNPYDLCNSSHRYITRQQSFLNIPMSYMFRGSPDIMSHYMVSPGMSPIYPLPVHHGQVFFPPDFNTDQYINQFGGDCVPAGDNSPFNQPIVCSPLPMSPYYNIVPGNYNYQVQQGE